SLRADLKLDGSSVGLLQGPAFTLVYVFVSLPLGRIADRTNRKILLIGGVCLWCSATVMCGMAPNFWVLFTGRLLLGVGEATLLPTAISMIADSFPAERRGSALGVFLFGSIVGGPFGITIGGLLLSLAA